MHTNTRLKDTNHRNLMLKSFLNATNLELGDEKHVADLSSRSS